MKFFGLNLLICVVSIVERPALTFGQSGGSENDALRGKLVVEPAVYKFPDGTPVISPIVANYPRNEFGVPAAVPKNSGGDFGIPPALPKNSGGDFGIPPALPKNPGGDFGIPPALPKNPGGDFGIPPALPKNPGGGFGVPPAVPKNPGGGFGVPPAVPKNPGGGFGVPPAVPKNPGGGFGVPPAVPKNPGNNFGVPPAFPKNPDNGVGVGPALPKNTGNVFGVGPAVPKNPGNSFGANPKHADNLSAVGPAIPKNPDGTPAVSKEEILRRTLCGDVSPNLRYDEKTKQCYRTSESDGPCGENMRFYELGAVNGECDCSRDSDVPLVYHPTTDRCYFVYQQAYCRRGQWLLFNRNNNPVCARNKCFNSRLKTQSWKENIRPDVVPLNGTGQCVRLLTNEGCQPDYIILFARKRVVPTCLNSKDGLQTKFLSPIGVLPCPAGSKSSISGNCNPDVEWDF